jgi:hypothetical protein
VEVDAELLNLSGGNMEPPRVGCYAIKGCQVSIREKVFHNARLRLPAHFFCVINFT